MPTPKPPIDCLPRNISYLLTILQIDTVLTLIHEYGGTRLIIPKHANTTHSLASCISQSEFAKLCSVFGGEVLDCPRCIKYLNVIRDNEILNQKRSGMTLSQLALKYHLTERAISNCLRRAEQAEYQQRKYNYQVDWLSLV